MITFLDGRIVRADAGGAIEIAVGPVAFEVFVPAGYDSDWKEGAEIRVFTHMLISAERPLIYGFKSAYDRNVFRLLLTASQVGPKAALGLLELGGDTVVRAIAAAEPRTLTAASGIGMKKAERIVLDLKDKVAEFGLPSHAGRETAGGRTAGTQAESEAVQALIGLGFSHSAALKAVTAAISDGDGGRDSAQLIRDALRKVRNN